MRTALGRWLCALATCLVVAGTAVATAPAAAAATPTYEKTPYSATIWKVDLHTRVSGTVIARRSMVSPRAWQEAGYPAPVIVPTRYTRLPWSPVITALALFGGVTTYQEDLDGGQWATAGYPAPDVWEAEYTAYPTAPQIFASTEVTGPIQLAYDQWAYAGYPDPDVFPYGFVRYDWSPRIFRITDFDTWAGAQITYSEWGGFYSYSPPALVDTAGAFVQTPGDPAVVYLDGDLAFQVTYDEWAAAGYPAPEQVP